ncbi:MAG: hypothetical protein ACR2MK_01680 [Solirubrobacteraceae bacterium]
MIRIDAGFDPMTRSSAGYQDGYFPRGGSILRVRRLSDAEREALGQDYLRFASWSGCRAKAPRARTPSFRPTGTGSSPQTTCS